MNTKLIFCLALVLTGGLFFTGCRGMGTQQFTAFAPAQSHELETPSRIVLDVTSRLQRKKADYDLLENISMLAPTPKHWKYDMTLQVERVIKGEFDDKTLKLHWLREPTKEQYESLGISLSAFVNFTNGTPLRIGFDDRSGEQLKKLKIMVRQQLARLVGKGTSKMLTEAEVSERVASELMRWGILGPIPQLDPEYTRMEDSVIQKIHGVRGFSESNDFNGDGTDWYEVELSPELAVELRATFHQSPAFKNTKPVFFNGAPSWWPAQWPADAQIYTKDLEYFVLLDSGTRAWLMRIRT